MLVAQRKLRTPFGIPCVEGAWVEGRCKFGCKHLTTVLLPTSYPLCQLHFCPRLLLNHRIFSTWESPSGSQRLTSGVFLNCLSLRMEITGLFTLLDQRAPELHLLHFPALRSHTQTAMPGSYMGAGGAVLSMIFSMLVQHLYSIRCLPSPQKGAFKF